MACCNNIPLIRATTITNAAGATTVTIPATPELVPGQVYDIGLFTAIPALTDGSTVTITNGTDTGFVMNAIGNYFRPLPLRSRTILRVLWLDDPDHFQLIGVRGFRGCRCA